MKKTSKNAKIWIIIILIIIVLAIVAINPIGMFVASQSARASQPTDQTSDASLTDIQWTPANPYSTQSVAVYGTIVNTGTVAIPSGSKLEFYVWYDGIPAPGINHTLNSSLGVGQGLVLYANSKTFTAGNHIIKLRIKPYFEDELSSNNERTETITVTTPPNQTGSIAASSNPSAASLYIDSIYKGITPITVTGLSVGNHAVKFTKTGYLDYTTSAYVYAGQTTNVFANLTLTNTTTDNPPTVNITHTGPYNLTNTTVNGTVVYTGSVDFLARAWDDIDLTNIKIYVDGGLKRTCTLSGTQTYGICTYTGLYNTGMHAYYATTIDSGSHTTTSTTGSFVVP